MEPAHWEDVFSFFAWIKQSVSSADSPESPSLFASELAKRVDEANIELVRVRANFDDQISSLQAEFAECSNRLADCVRERDSFRDSSSARSGEIDRLREDLRRVQSALVDSQNKESLFNNENEGLRRSLSELRSDLDLKSAEITHLRGECELKDREMGVVAKERSEILVAKSLLESENRNLLAREGDSETRKQVCMAELASVRDELTNLTRTLLTTQIETGQKTSRLECEIQVLKSENERNAELVAKLEYDLNNSEQKCESLDRECSELTTNHAQQLKECSHAIEALREKCLTESSLRSGCESKLQKSLDELNTKSLLIEELRTFNETLSSDFSALRSQVSEANKSREDEIVSLQTELKHANDLLRSVSSESVPDGLSADLSFTQIYSRYVELHLRQQSVENENQRLTKAYETFLKRIRDQAPIFNRQKTDLENSYRTIAELRTSLSLANQHLNTNKDENASKIRRANGLIKENEILRDEADELGRQVRVLTCEIALLRGENVEKMDGNDGYMSIDELHRANIQLRRRLKSVEADEEARSKVEALNERINSLNEQLNSYRSMVETLSNQRDAYKSLNEQSGTSDDDSKIIAGLRMELDKRQTDFANLQSDHNHFHERISSLDADLMGRLEDFRKELEAKAVRIAEMSAEIRSLQGRLASESGKFARAQSELDDQQKRYGTLANSFCRLQSNNEALSAMITALKAKIRDLELSKRCVDSENECLRCKVGRLNEELELIKKQWISNQTLADTLSSVKLVLSENERGNRFMIEKQIEMLETQLRQSNDRLANEEKRSRERIELNEKEIERLGLVVQNERNTCGQLREELAGLREKMIELSRELCEAQVRNAEGDFVGLVSGIDNECREWKAKVKHLEDELEAQKLLHSDMLKAFDEQKRFAEDLDRGLKQQIDAFAQKSVDSNAIIEGLKVDLDERKRELDEAKSEIDRIREGAMRKDREFCEKEKDWCKKSTDTLQMLNELNEKIGVLEEVKDKIEEELRVERNRGDELSLRVDESRVAFNELHKELETEKIACSSFRESLDKQKVELVAASEEVERLKSELKALNQRFDVYRSTYETLSSEYKDQLKQQPEQVQKLIDMLAAMRGNAEDETFVELHKALVTEQARLKESLARISLDRDQLLKANLELEHKFTVNVMTSTISDSASAQKEIDLNEQNIKDLREANCRLLEENQKLLDENTRLLLKQPCVSGGDVISPGDKRSAEPSSNDDSAGKRAKSEEIVKAPIQPIVWSDTSNSRNVRGTRRPRLRRPGGIFRRPGSGGGII